jgi:hypothetical protein
LGSVSVLKSGNTLLKREPAFMAPANYVCSNSMNAWKFASRRRPLARAPFLTISATLLSAWARAKRPIPRGLPRRLPPDGRFRANHLICWWSGEDSNLLRDAVSEVAHYFVRVFYALGVDDKVLDRLIERRGHRVAFGLLPVGATVPLSSDGYQPDPRGGGAPLAAWRARRTGTAGSTPGRTSGRPMRSGG